MRHTRVIPGRHAAGMGFAVWAAAAICGLAVTFHLAGIAIAVVRCRVRPFLPPPPNAPPVSLIRPVCGLDNFVEATLRTTFALDYPRCEILFCVACARDPAIPMLAALIAEHPAVPAKLLIGDERISTNPKLNNVVKGWRAASHELIVMSDSNVMLPRDYLQRLLARWRPDTGMVSAPPVGSRPEGFAAALECAFLNTYQARWQYVADACGFGFAQGKTLLYRRADIEAAGGLRMLANEVAEDAASTKLIRSMGRRVHLPEATFEQPLGERRCAEVWDRQARWARLRRDSFPALYCLEIFSGVLLPLAALAFVAIGTGAPLMPSIGALLVLWYGAEMLLAAACGWHLPLAYPLHALTRDALLPALWINGWRERSFMWRGNAMSVDEPDPVKTA